MPDYLLDTQHAAALWRNHHAVVARALAASGATIHLCVPAAAELWYRVYDSAKSAENERTLREFLARFTLIEFDAAAANEFGRIKMELRKIGRPISDTDAQIASIGKTRGLTVLTAEHHFACVSGLKRENWMV
ncbi:MAG TPA: type II toxin-antitoxin system VapC family toxin [Tepidisphaeraceae bacterium]|jgi:tRNA(fMet)-specific endonuclease VapC